MKEIKVHINGKEYSASAGESILQVAIRNGIDIPHFCHHDDLPTESRCRTCLVEVEKTGKVTTSCDLKAKKGLSVKTDTAEVEKLRKTNMELLLAGHKENCPKCQKGLYCKVAERMDKYDVSGSEYDRPQIDADLYKMCKAAEIDPQLCIACNKCVEICEKIGVGFLKMEGKGNQTHAGHTKKLETSCIYCGQCTLHCPVAAAREISQIEEVEKALNDKDKVVIAQMAPSVRTSIGEEFGMPIGTNLTAQAYTAFRNLGFDKVFDVNMGADITTIVEAEELVERIKENRDLPMFTSCCPAWVKFMELHYRDMLNHLTTARSPQIHAGAIYKTWWAEKENIDPKNIVVVSFMPCTSKKYEASLQKLKIDGMLPVDNVLTTREFALLLKKYDINLPELEPGEVDTQGEYTGAAAIYGASGGVMESALRTACFKLTGEDMGRLEFEEVRGMKGIKKTEVTIGEKKLKVAVVSTVRNARKILEEVKEDSSAYDYVEVMACPGGCIGGGGQPIPTTFEIVKKRIESLYKIDTETELRKAHQNPVVKDIFDNYLNNLPEERRKKILETGYLQIKK
ncbi:MAG: [FeFe] hydrogenase, group A [Patescibacteria group bacterium]